MKDILILIPAYNEEKSICQVVNGLKSRGYDNILVVDDGSNDRTFEMVHRLNVYVARHLLNRGAGNATATGFAIAKILDPEIIVTFDADGQHDASDIVKLIGPIKRGEADVVISSRMLAKRPAMPSRRIIYNKIANLATFIFYGFSVSDTQSGLKAFSRKAFNAIEIKSAGMEFCSEIIAKIKEKGLKFKEVSVRSIYTDYSMSKGQSFVTGVETFFRLVLNKVLRG